jgi:hypothetical protein
MQIDGKNPISSTRNTLLRSQRHGDSHRSVAPLEEDSDSGGTIIASATRTIKLVVAIARASSPHVVMSTKRCNNIHVYPAAGMMQGLRAKLNPRPAYRMLLRLISGRRSTTVTTHGASLRQGEGTNPIDTTKGI